MSEKLVNDGVESPPPEEGGKEPETKAGWTAEQQAEFDKRAAALRKAAEAEGRKKAQAEFEAKQKTAQEEADKKRLEEEGKFKEASQMADKAKIDAEERAEEAEKKAETLALQMSFDRTVRSMNIEFANEQAAEDAFVHLDRSLLGEDKSGMKKAIEQLQKDRPYYFGSPQTTSKTDARERGKHQTTKESEEEIKNKIVQRFNIRKPR